MAGRALHDALQWSRGLLARLVSLEVIDRSLVVGAQAFSALVPLLIVVAGVGSPDGSSFADAVVDRFDLEGDTADAVHQSFGAGTGGATVTFIGAAIVFFSALSFTRAVQRTFELTWGLQRRGMRSTGWGMAWLAVFATYLSVFPIVRGIFHGWPYNIISLAGTLGIWLATPYILLGRRIAWRRLVPQAALSAAGMTCFSGAMLLYAPRAIESSSEDFGAIGVAFTILWGYGFVLVVAAATGAYITQTGGQPRRVDLTPSGERDHPVG